MDLDHLAALRDFWISCHLPAEAWPTSQQYFDRFARLIATHIPAASLMGPAGTAQFALKHVADSLAAVKAWPSLFAGPPHLADVGTGAGLPGLVLAIALPELHVTAIESNLRKADFVRIAAAELGLAARVRVVARRSREMARSEEFAGKFALVTARAVAPAGKLVRELRPLLAPRGSAILYKTPAAVVQELPLARREATKFDLTIETSQVVELPLGAGTRQFLRLIAAG